MSKQNIQLRLSSRHKILAMPSSDILAKEQKMEVIYFSKDTIKNHKFFKDSIEKDKKVAVLPPIELNADYYAQWKKQEKFAFLTNLNQSWLKFSGHDPNTEIILVLKGEEGVDLLIEKAESNVGKISALEILKMVLQSPLVQNSLKLYICSKLEKTQLPEAKEMASTARLMIAKSSQERHVEVSDAIPTKPNSKSQEDILLFLKNPEVNPALKMEFCLQLYESPKKEIQEAAVEALASLCKEYSGKITWGHLQPVLIQAKSIAISTQKLNPTLQRQMGILLDSLIKSHPQETQEYCQEILHHFSISESYKLSLCLSLATSKKPELRDIAADALVSLTGTPSTIFTLKNVLPALTPLIDSFQSTLKTTMAVPMIISNLSQHHAESEKSEEFDSLLNHPTLDDRSKYKFCSALAHSQKPELQKLAARALEAATLEPSELFSLDMLRVMLDTLWQSKDSEIQRHIHSVLSQFKQHDIGLHATTEWRDQITAYWFGTEDPVIKKNLTMLLNDPASVSAFPFGSPKKMASKMKKGKDYSAAFESRKETYNDPDVQRRLLKAIFIKKTVQLSQVPGLREARPSMPETKQKQIAEDVFETLYELSRQDSPHTNTDTLNLIREFLEVLHLFPAIHPLFGAMIQDLPFDLAFKITEGLSDPKFRHTVQSQLINNPKHHAVFLSEDFLSSKINSKTFRDIPGMSFILQALRSENAPIQIKMDKALEATLEQEFVDALGTENTLATIEDVSKYFPDVLVSILAATNRYNNPAVKDTYMQTLSNFFASTRHNSDPLLTNLAMALATGVFTRQKAYTKEELDVIMRVSRKLATTKIPYIHHILEQAIDGNQLNNSDIVRQLLCTPFFETNKGKRAVLRYIQRSPIQSKLKLSQELLLNSEDYAAYGLPKEMDHLVFGSNVKSGAVIDPILRKTVGAHLNLNDLLDDDKEYVWMLYGNLDAPLLILYKLENLSKLEWGGTNSGYGPFEQVDAFQIFDFSRCKIPRNKDESSKMIGTEYADSVMGYDLNTEHKIFPKLPLFLQQCIQKNQFNFRAYRDSKIIQTLTEDMIQPILAKDLKAGRMIKSAICSVIGNRGNEIQLASSYQEDVDIKRGMNVFFAENSDVAQRLNTIIDEVFNNLPNTRQKAKFAFLLGTLAKAGALGYHVAGDNQANELFYKAAERCFLKLRNSHEITLPPNLFHNFSQGLCMGLQMGSVSNHNPWLRSVFDKR